MKSDEKFDPNLMKNMTQSHEKYDPNAMKSMTQI